MYTPWHHDDGFEETELALDREFAIARFLTESGYRGLSCLLDEQEKDSALLRSILDGRCTNRQM